MLNFFKKNCLQQENIPEIEEETHRLAVVNMDWGRVKVRNGNWN